MKLILVALSLLGFAALAADTAITLPAETMTFRPGAGAELAQQHCLVCHSVEYIAYQPPAPRAFWAASVKKMREKYAVAIVDPAVDPLIDYLTSAYGQSDPK